MYALVSAAVLAADLAVHPTGGDVVDVLDRALRLTPDELALLGEVYADDLARQAAWHTVTTCCGLATVTAGGAAGPPAIAGTYGGLPELVDCLTEEVLGWTRVRVDELAVIADPLGVRAVTDALGAAYAGALLPADQTARLRRPWSQLVGEGPSVAPSEAFGPRSAGVRAVVDRLSRADRQSLLALRESHHRHEAGSPESSEPRDWAQCMHAAAQAAFLHGRVREVASAQLAVARAARLAEVSPDLAADGVMTAATGAVQAVALADVVALDVLELLTQSWTDVFGAP